MNGLFEKFARIASLSVVGLGIFIHATTAKSQQSAANSSAAHESTIGSISGISFSELKNTVISKISGAKARVWLTSDYLTDGDVVGALHLAKYRKIDVKVLLGRRKANAYMSRLRFLKEQNIPTAIKPSGFPITSGSAILSDDQLYLINGDLDFRTNQNNFKVTPGSSADTATYTRAFDLAIHGKFGRGNFQATATPVPQVGERRPAQRGRLAPYSPGTSASKWQQPSRPKQPANTNGAYRYSNQGNARPEGIPNRLPKVLKWQEVERQRKRQQAQDGRQ